MQCKNNLILSGIQPGEMSCVVQGMFHVKRSSSLACWSGDRSALELVPERSRGVVRIAEELVPEMVSSTPLGDRSALELVPERSRGVVRITEELVPELVSSTPLGDRSALELVPERSRGGGVAEGESVLQKS
ncbi:MAG: hypothetical protein FMNOHCHN_01669 [Ignavibacteriaceae bacterium]|nr:hypothetical protein [Ignavibacteriaceae bacterium]